MTNPIDQFQLSTLARKANATGILKQEKNGKQDPRAEALNTQARHQADRIELLQVMLKTRVTRGLDTAIANAAKEQGLEGQIFIAINSYDHTAEVLPLEEVLNSDDITDPAEAEQIRRNPVMMHQGDAKVSTPNDGRYQKVRDAINQFFNDYQDEFRFLRGNQVANKPLSDFYKPV